MTGGLEALTWEEKGIGFGSEPLQLSGISSGNQTNQTVAPAKTVWSCVVSISSETIMRVLMKDISYVRESEVSIQNNSITSCVLFTLPIYLPLKNLLRLLSIMYHDTYLLFQSMTQHVSLSDLSLSSVSYNKWESDAVSSIEFNRSYHSA